METTGTATRPGTSAAEATAGTVAVATADAAMAAEAVALTRALIRIDSTNTGDPRTTGDGESRCARLIEEQLAEVGLTGTWYERTPGRGNLVVRVAGSDPGAGALLVHGHTDVVPAALEDWSVDPFAAQLRDGCVWGRGAVDMKHMLGMTVAAVRRMAREGSVPVRDLVLAFVADEEVDSSDGMAFLVEQHPEAFAGVTEAVGECGGHTVALDPQRRVYTVGVGEKAVGWATLRARGTTGHGSSTPNAENAVARVAAAVDRIAQHEWPVVVGEGVGAFLDALEGLLGRPLDRTRLDEELAALGPVAASMGAVLRTTTAPTSFHAGYKENVVPGEATATVDCRIPPGAEDAFAEVFAGLVGDGVEVSWLSAPAVGVPAPFGLLDAVARAVDEADPGAAVLPIVSSGVTDAKALSRLGIECYGFSPLPLPTEFDFAGMFHGVDERVPVAGVEAGAVLLHRFLRAQ